MLKKTIALTLIFALLAPASSALAAACEDTDQTVIPSIEEILDEYHKRSISQQATGISLCSAGKCLEDETIDTLNNAGYEAYYVTGDNYDELEELLQTDFSAMGLSNESSYIVAFGASPYAIPGETSPLPDYGYDPGQESGSGRFYYTYNNVEYLLRIAYVTAGTDTSLAQTSTVCINDRESNDMLDIVLSVVAGSIGLGFAWTFMDILEANLPDGVLTTFSNIIYTAGSSWTVLYTQVYDSDSGDWITCGSSEYVKLRHWVDYVYYDSAQNAYDRYSIEEVIGTQYSSMYNNSSARNESAIQYYLRGQGYLPDIIDSVEYKFNEEVVITHCRD